MSKPETVACVIPMFNAELFIEETIQSVLNQSYPVREIVVVDDGSTDSSATIVTQQFDRITYLYQPNAGAVTARNRGLEATSCDFIAFLDADDLWADLKLEKQMARFAGDPELGASLTYMQNFWTEDVAHERDTVAGSTLLEPQPGIASTLVARARTFVDAGPLNENLKHRDIQEWLVRVENKGWKKEVLTDVLLERRIHAHNVSRNRMSPDADEFLEIARAAIAGKRKPDDP